MQGVERAALLLLGLGEENAANVLKHMDPKEVHDLGTAMTSLKDFNQDDVIEIVDSFLNEVETQVSLGFETEKYISTALTEALGKERANPVIEKILDSNNKKGLAALKWMEPTAIAEIVKSEHPQIIAVILSFLDGDNAAQFLQCFPEEQQLDLIIRLSNSEPIQPHVLDELNEILENQFTQCTSTKGTALGGDDKIANILNYLDKEDEEKIMNEIGEANPDLVDSIKEKMFVFADLSGLDDRGIQSLLKEVSSEHLLLSLKAIDEDLKEKIFKNMSKRAAQLMKDDLDAKGPVKLSEVEEAQKEIVAVARKMIDAGDIVLVGGKSSEEMV